MATIHSTSRQALARSYGIGLRARTSSRALISPPTPSSGTSLSTSSAEWSHTPRHSLQREYMPCSSFRSLTVYGTGERRFHSTNAAIAEGEQEMENDIEQDLYEGQRLMSEEQDLAGPTGQQGSVTASDEYHTMMLEGDKTLESVCNLLMLS